MHHIDCLGVAHGVHGTVGIALVILDHLQHTRTTEAFERFGIRMFLSALRQVQRIAEGVLPDNGLRRRLHCRMARMKDADTRSDLVL